MNPLASRLLEILVAETGFPPLSADMLTEVLRVIGCADGDVAVADVEAALADLMADGQVERVWSRGSGRYRVLARR